MISFYPFVLIFTTSFLVFGEGTEPLVKCPLPVSPSNGRIFLAKTGTVVKYECDSGFELRGPQITICKEDEWYPDPPTCEPISVEEEKEQSTEKTDQELPLPYSVPRPISEFGDSDNKDEGNDTMQNDEARVHMVLYPRERVVTTKKVNLMKEKPKEDKKRKKPEEKQKPTTTTIAPSITYVRRPLVTGQSWPYYYRAPSHVVVSNDENNARAYEEALRYYYWTSQYPRSQLTEYRPGHPLGLTLSESQQSWINSLHPEVRDRYLKDLYDIEIRDANYLTYPNSYHYGYPYYARQPLSVVINDPIAAVDYSCHRTERDGYVVMIEAPRIPNASLPKYDRKQNPNYPYNDYLVAQYECKTGYTLLDSRNNELHCSRSTWIGNSPVCVPQA